MSAGPNDAISGTWRRSNSWCYLERQQEDRILKPLKIKWAVIKEQRKNVFVCKKVREKLRAERMKEIKENESCVRACVVCV